MPGAYGDSSGGQRRPPAKKPVKDTIKGTPRSGIDSPGPKPKGSLKPKLKKTAKMPQARKYHANPYAEITQKQYKKMTPAQRLKLGGRFKT